MPPVCLVEGCSSVRALCFWHLGVCRLWSDCPSQRLAFHMQIHRSKLSPATTSCMDSLPSGPRPLQYPQDRYQTTGDSPTPSPLRLRPLASPSLLTRLRRAFPGNHNKGPSPPPPPSASGPPWRSPNWLLGGAACSSWNCHKLSFPMTITSCFVGLLLPE